MLKSHMTSFCTKNIDYQFIEHNNLKQIQSKQLLLINQIKYSGHQ